MTVLFITSTAMEFAGLARRFPLRRLAWPVDYAAELDRAGERWLLVANGAGRALALEALEIVRERASIDAVVSTGFCGALDPAIAAAEVVVANGVRNGAELWPAAAALGRTAASPRTGLALGADHMVASLAEKRALHAATGAATVDMESHALAAAARQAGLPFFCIRAVTDTATENLHLDFSGARDAQGRFRAGRLVASSLRRPWRGVPELVKLASRARRASEQLGGFLADCRF